MPTSLASRQPKRFLHPCHRPAIARIWMLPSINLNQYSPTNQDPIPWSQCYTRSPRLLQVCDDQHCLDRLLYSAVFAAFFVFLRLWRPVLVRMVPVLGLWLFFSPGSRAVQLLRQFYFAWISISACYLFSTTAAHLYQVPLLICLSLRPDLNSSYAPPSGGRGRRRLMQLVNA